MSPVKNIVSAPSSMTIAIRPLLTALPSPRVGGPPPNAGTGASPCAAFPAAEAAARRLAVDSLGIQLPQHSPALLSSADDRRCRGSSRSRETPRHPEEGGAAFDFSRSDPPSPATVFLSRPAPSHAKRDPVQRHREEHDRNVEESRVEETPRPPHVELPPGAERVREKPASHHEGHHKIDPARQPDQRRQETDRQERQG